MALHIQIFGSPGSGKSTTRSRLFYELKMRGYKVEEITEHAKDLTYDENYSHLSDQVLLLGKQHHFHQVLDKKVDYIVTDSPFIMGVNYIDEKCPYKKEFINLSLSMNSSYRTLNIFLIRKHKYQEFGRRQSETESDEKSLEIKNFLDNNNIKYITMETNDDFIDKIINIIKEEDV